MTRILAELTLGWRIWVDTAIVFLVMVFWMVCLAMAMAREVEDDDHFIASRRSINLLTFPRRVR